MEVVSFGEIGKGRVKRDIIPEAPGPGPGLDLPVQVKQGGQVTLQIGFISGPVAGVRLDQGPGDFPANSLGQHRVQPDMRIAAQVTGMGAGFVRMLGGMVAPRTRPVAGLMVGQSQQRDTLDGLHHHQVAGVPGAQ